MKPCLPPQAEQSVQPTNLRKESIFTPHQRGHVVSPIGARAEESRVFGGLCDGTAIVSMQIGSLVRVTVDMSPLSARELAATLLAVADEVDALSPER